MFFLNSKNKQRDLDKEKIISKKWFFFSWEILAILIATFIVMLMNFLPQVIFKESKVFFQDGHGGEDYYISNPLRDNIIYESFLLGVTILCAIFIGIYTEIGKYIGKYSSTLFLLVPSLVWLISDRSNNHIGELILTEESIIQTFFYITLGIFIFYIITSFIKKILILFSTNYQTKESIEFIFNFLNRIIIVFLNIGIIMVLACTLINFGVFTLRLTDIPEATRETFLESTGNELGFYDLHTEKFITFIAIIAVLFALLMVSINLSDEFIATKLGKNSFIQKQNLDFSKLNNKKWKMFKKLRRK